MAVFSPGDVVFIRDWDDMEQEFGLNKYGSIECRCHFIPQMQCFCGMRFTIESINERQIVKFSNPLAAMQEYSFSTDMIRHDQDTAYTVPEISVDDFFSLIM